MNNLLMDLSGCYYKDILVGDFLYVIRDDRFCKITSTDWDASWIIIHSGDFSYAGDIEETLPKTEFRLYRERYAEPFGLK